MFALKSIKIDDENNSCRNYGGGGRGGGDMMGKEKSAMIEVEILKMLKNEYFVKVMEKEHFIISKNPTSFDLNEKGKKKYFCVVQEYIHGSNIEELLNWTEEKNYRICGTKSIKWFIMLIEGLVYLNHEIKVLHLDIKPDNIIIAPVEGMAFSVDDKNGNDKEFIVKYTDFGLACKIGDHSSSTTTDKGKKRTLVGTIYYASPEISLHGYDLSKIDRPELIDVYSLGLVGFQLFYNVSVSEFVRSVRSIMRKIKSDKKLKKEFCDFYGIDDISDVGGWSDIIQFIHFKDLIFSEVILPYCKDDPGIHKVLRSMICPSKQRKTAEELSSSKELQTWRKVLDEDFSIEMFNHADFDFHAVLSMFGSCSPSSVLVFENCLDIMNLGKSYNDYFDEYNEQQRILAFFFKRYKTSKEYPKKSIRLLLKVLIRHGRNKGVVRQISVGLITFGFVDILENLITKSSDLEYIHFVLHLMVYYKPIRKQLSKCCSAVWKEFRPTRTLSLTHSLASDSKIDEILSAKLKHLIQMWIPSVDDKNLLTVDLIVGLDLWEEHVIWRKSYENAKLVITKCLEKLKKCLKIENSAKIRNYLIILLFHCCRKNFDLVIEPKSKEKISEMENSFSVIGSCERKENNSFKILNPTERVKIFHLNYFIQGATANDSKVISYVEYFIIDSGMNSVVMLGMKNQKKIVSKKEFLISNEDFLGIGLKENGDIFYVQNCRIVETVKLNLCNCRLYNFIRSVNGGLTLKINFGQDDFSFIFKNTQDLKEGKNRIQLLKKYKNLFTNIMIKYPQNDQLLKICCILGGLIKEKNYFISDPIMDINVKNEMDPTISGDVRLHLTDL